MNIREYQELQDAYQGVYQELDEVKGGGRIDPVSDFPHHGERARSPKDAGLKMSPIDRAEARANALKKRNDPEATKRANRISSRFIGPTKRGIGRAIDASNAARTAEKKRLMNPQESYEYDTSDAILEKIVVGVSKYLEPDMKKRGENNKKAIEDMKKTKAHKDMVATARKKFDEEVETDIFTQVLEHLVAEGYADTNENAIAIMANMSEEWREEILDEAKKKFPEDKVDTKSAKHERDYLKRPNSQVGQRSLSNARKMKAIASTVSAGDDPRSTMHGQDLRKIK